MTPAQFEKLDRLFQAALELPAGKRRSFLEIECASDPELIPEILAMLELDAAATPKLDSIVAGAVAGLDRMEEAGTPVGPYLLIREIGRGGMAVVHQAIRTDGEFLQTVAIKLVQHGMDQRRFRTERQILATLSHPNIASLLDGGTAPDGRPYLVMELIEGETITELSKRLDLREKLRLFRQVCGAVQYAHDRQVVHRDIKPGNVMVTSDGVPKLLDFGIAKMLSPEFLGPNVAHTESQVRLMTPDYASPEQVRGEALTPATDIYSLGVLLYEMLTGERPFSSYKGSPSEMERAICFETAPRRQLSGDLATLVEKAMRKEPERRYASAAAFDLDIENFLAGRPVKARPDTFRYRARKWLKRKPYAAAAIVLSILVVSGCIVMFRVWQQTEAHRRAVALTARGFQLLQQDPRSSAGSDSLRESVRFYELATKADPTYAPAWVGLAEAADLCIDLDRGTAPRYLDQASAAAKTAVRLDDRAAKAWEMLAVVRGRQRRQSDALDAYARAVELNPAAPYAVRGYSTVLYRMGRAPDAIRVVKAAIDRLPDTANPDPAASNIRGKAILQSHLAMLQYQLGKLKEAESAALMALETDRTYRLAYWGLGLVYEAQGRLAEAERELRTAVRLAPRDARQIAALAHNLARQGKRSEALSYESQLLQFRPSGSAACPLAILHAGLRDQSAVVFWLEQAAAESGFSSCLDDPRLRPYTQDPKLAPLMARLAIGVN